MRTPKARFHGMDPWPLATGMTRCAGTPLGDINLHTDCDVLRVNVDLRPRAFTIDLRHRATTTRARLRFTGARVVRLDAAPRPTPDVLHSIDHYPDPLTGHATFALDVGGFHTVLRAAAVRFELLSR